MSNSTSQKIQKMTRQNRYQGGRVSPRETEGLVTIWEKTSENQMVYTVRWWGKSKTGVYFIGVGSQVAKWLDNKLCRWAMPFNKYCWQTDKRKWGKMYPAVYYIVCITYCILWIWQKLVEPVAQFVPQHLICPLTKKLFVDPVKTRHGAVYERKAIEKHLKT